MYENKRDPIAPLSVFYRRVFKSLLVAMAILSICLLIGVLGYHHIAGLPWIDAVHNASMILSGMGPVAEVKNFSGKVFSSAYALFSGVAFITNVGFLLAPAAHRFFHKLHVDEKDVEEGDTE
jgi:hypothetical protein